MLLFYSNHCVSSKLLIDNIKRYNATEFFKMVNVEQYLASGKKLPPQIHSVPAIMFRENKTLLFGKQVFDYLLLPGKGFLLNLPNKNKKDTSVENIPTEPVSFSLHAGIGSGDAYSFIEEQNNDTQKGYVWSMIDEHHKIPTPAEEEMGMMEETRSKKGLPDISSVRSNRELDLQNFLTPQAQAVPLPPR